MSVTNSGNDDRETQQSLQNTFHTKILEIGGNAYFSRLDFESPESPEPPDLLRRSRISSAFRWLIKYEQPALGGIHVMAWRLGRVTSELPQAQFSIFSLE